MQSSECISLLRCTRDINPHLGGFNVVDVSLRSEIQLLWARVGTETNFTLMHRSIRNFNFPTPWKLNSSKLVLQIPTHGAKIMFKCPTKFIFFFFLKRENSGNSWVFYFTVPGEWEIWTLRGWGGEFEPEMWVFLEVKEVKVCKV